MIGRKQPYMLCALSLIAGLTLPARAEPGALMTGRALALLCDSTKAEDQFSCQSYIAGVIDYHRLTKSLGTSPTVDFCLPDDIKMAQLKQVVSLYIRRHTEHQDFIAAPGVAMALFNGFPCQTAKKKR